MSIYSFANGSTISPRRARTTPRASASSLPTLATDLSSQPSYEDILCTPPSASSSTLLEQLPFHFSSCKEEPIITPPDGLYPPMSIPPGVIFRGVKRVGSGQHHGLWPDEWHYIPLPTTSFGEEYRTLENGKYFVSQEEDEYFLLINERYRAKGTARYTSPPPARPYHSVSEAETSPTELVITYTSPKLCRRERVTSHWWVEGVLGEHLDRIHNGKEGLRIATLRGTNRMKEAVKKVVGRVKAE